MPKHVKIDMETLIQIAVPYKMALEERKNTLERKDFHLEQVFGQKKG